MLKFVCITRAPFLVIEYNYLLTKNKVRFAPKSAQFRNQMKILLNNV